MPMITTRATMTMITTTSPVMPIIIWRGGGHRLWSCSMVAEKRRSRRPCHAERVTAEPESAAHALDRLTAVIPDFPEPGIQFRDLTPVFADATALRTVICLLYT